MQRHRRRECRTDSATRCVVAGPLLRRRVQVDGRHGSTDSCRPARAGCRHVGGPGVALATTSSRPVRARRWVHPRSATDLLNGERLTHRRGAGWIEPGDTWARCCRREVAGFEFLTLAEGDEILVTVAHALRHSYRRLTWLVDFVLQLRYTSLCRRALGSGAGGPTSSQIGRASCRERV